MNAITSEGATGRVRWLVRGAVVWAALILGRLVYLQVVASGEYRELAAAQQVRLKELRSSRGTIFDRRGHALAMSVPVETITLNPSQLPDRALAAHLIAPILELDESELLERIESYAAKGRGYLIVAKRVSAERAGRLRNLGVEWIQFEPEGVRKYPNGMLAAHLLGGVDHSEHGNGGVEMRFDDDLAGMPGYERVVSDVRRRSFESSLESEPHAARDIVLTIDRRIQFAADHALRQAVIDNQCDSGTAIVMDPHTGEILAMSSYPTYDPNEPPRGAADVNARRNLAVGDPFEPGSIFKVFTIAGAIDVGAVTPETEFFCHNGAFSFFGRTIHEAKGGYGTLTVEQILAKSSNIGALKVGLKMSEKSLHDYLLRFGFNQQTAVDLPGESGGLVFRLSKWQPGSIGSVAMGHEVLTTSVQLARGVAAIANGGLLVQPRLTRPKTVDGPALQLVAYRPSGMEPKRIIKPETAITMRRMMETVVLEGTGKGARLDGYSSGGKTGTAQMFDKATGRYSHRYNASFMGFAPVTNPAIVVVATLNGSSKYGGVIAAPVFKQIAETALRVMNVPPDIPETAPAEPEKAAPASDLAVVAQGAQEASARIAEAIAESQEADAGAIAVGPPVPNFVGKPLRTVMEEALAAGVRIDPIGSGVAQAQYPTAGARLAAGQKVRVVFER